MKRKKWLGIGIVALMATILVITGVNYMKTYGTLGTALDKKTAASDPVITPKPLDEKTEKIISNIALLEKKSAELLKTDKLATLTDATAVNDATMAVIRKDRYGNYTSGMESLFWDNLAGPLPQEYVAYFSSTEGKNDQVVKSLGASAVFIDSKTNAAIDFVHMIAVIDSEYTTFSTVPYEEQYYNYICGWGGDLETFAMDLIPYSTRKKIKTYEGLLQFTKTTMGAQPSHFSRADLLADMDGVNIGRLMRDKKLLLSEAMRQYYQFGVVDKRADLFIDSFGGDKAFQGAVGSFLNGTIDAAKSGDERYVSFMGSYQENKGLILDKLFGGIRMANKVEKKVLGDAFIEIVMAMRE